MSDDKSKATLTDEQLNEANGGFPHNTGYGASVNGLKCENCQHAWLRMNSSENICPKCGSDKTIGVHF